MNTTSGFVVSLFTFEAANGYFPIMVSMEENIQVIARRRISRRISQEFAAFESVMSITSDESLLECSSN